MNVHEAQDMTGDSIDLGEEAATFHYVDWDHYQRIIDFAKTNSNDYQQLAKLTNESLPSIQR